MGVFFSTIQIYNNRQEKREQFIKSLCKHMEKRGFSLSSEDDANLSYVLAFSENDNWVTLGSSKYEAGGEIVRSDVQWLAEALNTCCISTTVIDSDFSILEMYNGTSSMTDMVIVGDGSGYGFDDDTAFKGKRECWEMLLTENSTWEQLSEVWGGNYTFAEEALEQMAPLLGMDSKNIAADYHYWEEIDQDNQSLSVLHFKKSPKTNKPAISLENSKASIKKNPSTLNAAFKQVFGEALAPLGFVKIKGKQPYFVRLIGNEIIHVITYRNEPMSRTGYKEFDVWVGVATVYRQKIDLTMSPSDNLIWLHDIFELYTQSHPFDFDPDFRRSIYTFSYKADDDKSMVDAVKYSLELTENIVLPIFNDVTDLDSCIEYFYKYKQPRSFNYGDENFNNNDPNHYCDEGLLNIRINNVDSFIERAERYLERELAIEAHQMKNGMGGFTQEGFEKWCRIAKEAKPQRIARCNEIFNNREWCTKALEELEMRKTANTETLRSYGLDL